MPVRPIDGRRCCTPPASGLAHPGRRAPQWPGSAPPHRCTRWSDRTRPGPRRHRREWMVPLITVPGGKPVTAVPGLTPRSPEINDGPVLVTVAAGQHRERGGRPQPDRRLYRRRRRHRRPNDPRYKPHGGDGAHRQHRPDPTPRTVSASHTGHRCHQLPPINEMSRMVSTLADKWMRPRAEPVLVACNERRPTRLCRSSASHPLGRREPLPGEQNRNREARQVTYDPIGKEFPRSGLRGCRRHVKTDPRGEVRCGAQARGSGNYSSSGQPSKKPGTSSKASGREKW